MLKIILLVLALAQVCPPGVCPPPEQAAVPDLPFRPTVAWVEFYAARIAQSECMGVPSACDFVVTQMIHDIERGYDPYGLHPWRWHGWNNNPTQETVDAAWRAVREFPMYPRCTYVGNKIDMIHWIETGAVKDSVPHRIFADNGKTAVFGMDCQEGR